MMSASAVFLHLAGGVALLIWAVRMVRTGVVRAFGSSLRSVLASATRNRVTAVLAGAGVTVLMQSATATAMLLTSFSRRGLVPLAMALAVVLGLHRHLSGKGGTVLILAGVFFGTALRMEGAALALLAAGAVFLTGKRGLGMATAVVGVLPLGLFALWLTSLGLDPTPSSVKAKLALTNPEEISFVVRRLTILLINLREAPGMLLAGFAFASLVLWRMSPRLKSSRWGIFAAVIILATFAHLGFGHIGWLNRYEQYILVIAGGGLLALIPKAMGDQRPNVATIAGVAGVILGGMVAYKTPVAFIETARCGRAIHLQQAQMAVFAKEYLGTDVAVNDLGWVAFQNPNYVLDLWGLASAEARVMRLDHATPGWTGTLTEKYDVPAALVYENWFEDGIGKDWVRIGRLNLTISGGFLGGYTVSFFATGPEHVDMMRDAVSAWTPTLLPHSEFIWDEGMEP